MRTKNGHDITIECPSPYGGPGYGCKRCGMAGVYSGGSPSDEQIIESIDKTPCKPTQLTLDQERGKHQCHEAVGTLEKPRFTQDSYVTYKDEKGWLLDTAWTSMRVAFCPFCGVKLGELPPTKTGDGA